MLGLHAGGSDLHSHILLVPFISAYLVFIQRDRLPRNYSSSSGAAGFFFVIGLVALVAGWLARRSDHPLSHNDDLALTIFSFIALLMAAGFAFLGRHWMKSTAFPFFFLLFMIPLPDQAVDWLETASKLASAEAAHLFFSVSGIPYMRDKLLFYLPNIVLEVAQECSGIRSSFVLFITSLLAAHLFLTQPWRRALLVAVVIPLGILRNGFRILVIGLLCVEVGPHMIHSVVHRRGGPLFFALSLIPLFLLLWWLRKGEAKQGAAGNAA